MPFIESSCQPNDLPSKKPVTNTLADHNLCLIPAHLPSTNQIDCSSISHCNDYDGSPDAGEIGQNIRPMPGRRYLPSATVTVASLHRTVLIATS